MAARYTAPDLFSLCRPRPLLPLRSILLSAIIARGEAGKRRGAARVGATRRGAVRCGAVRAAYDLHLVSPTLFVAARDLSAWYSVRAH